ncbi:MAG TPA: asparagine synthase-related protein, partial [Chloroflexota bacterium]|nr:asparagine synthase-related protein [Chloroflexota bacterium]
IIAAYRAWSEACVHRLEGDFAFLLWDRRRRSLFCSRDFGGSRTLYYADLGSTLIVASSMGCILAHPQCPQDLNPVAVADAAAGLLASSHETAYRAIYLLPAGCSLTWRERKTRITRFWDPPLGHESRVPFADAAEELRELLCRAVAERLDLKHPTSVWLSGGYDSTAVFASGEQVLEARGNGQHLQAISISYPPGDSGREDELIEAVVEHWGSRIAWIDITDIPFFDRPSERAAERDDPLAHAFESTNRALARVTRDAGSRVAFGGNGGDQLFQVSSIHLVDLFRTGRWLELAREWHAEGHAGSGFRTFFTHAVQPALPRPLLAFGRILRRGRPLRGFLERPLPDWIDPEFARRHGLLERERVNTPKRGRLGYAEYEMYWYLTSGYGPRIASIVQVLALENSVEYRSPLYDRRVVEFATSRPRHERRSSGETKRLLRRAMHGMLPDQVIAPRRYRTGTMHDYLARSMRESHAAFIAEALSQPLALAELGIVIADVLRQRWDYYQRTNDHILGLQLFFTLQAELWLRAHGDGGTQLHRKKVPDVAAGRQAGQLREP